jgi:hypothetical protein
MMNLVKLTSAIKHTNCGLYSLSTGEYISDRISVTELSEVWRYSMELIDTRSMLEDFIGSHGFLLDQDGSYLMFKRDKDIVSLCVVSIKVKDKPVLSAILEISLILLAIYLSYKLLFILSKSLI